ncbi:MAG: N-acetylmuramoyl-L-alanine amidase [Gemmatimonadota bacterium]
MSGGAAAVRGSGLAGRAPERSLAGRRAAAARRPLALALLLMASAVAGCSARREAPPPAGNATLPGPPELRVVYPAAGAFVTASDSTFIFGSVSPPGVHVAVNGVPARQAPGGGWLAYVPVESGDFTFRVTAAAPAGATTASARPDVASLEVPVRVVGGFDASWHAVLDTASVTPRQEMELHPGDVLPVRFRGVPGLRARAVLGEWDPSGSEFHEITSAPFAERRRAEPNVGRQVFGPADAEEAPEGAAGAPPPPNAAARAPAAPGGGAVWYRADLILPGPTVEGDPFLYDGYRGVLAGCGEGQPKVCGGWRQLAVEVAQADSTMRYQLARAAVLVRDPARSETVVLDDDPEGGGRTDEKVSARTGPDGVYFLFLPNGTVARAERRIGASLELRLAADLSVWTDTAQVTDVPEPGPVPRSLVPVVRTSALGEWTRLRVPLERRLPVQVRQATRPARYEVTIFGATSATEFLRYDGHDRLVRELRWNQRSDDRFVLEVELAGAQPWGFRYGYEGTDFVLDVRRPPVLEDDVLQGRTIVVDPGHAPEPGAIGPTGLQERDVNLAVALELARELEDAGARVVLTRRAGTPADSLPGLNDRTNLAAREEADLLVSVHHNALPDGVNPFENNGTSVFYNHPQSLPLARAIQSELRAELGLPDYGVGIGNLALTRATEMPAVLTEAAFMMIPEQEELLRTTQFQRREAAAIRRGIERFLRESRAR